jgi:kynurenine formamidase
MLQTVRAEVDIKNHLSRLKSREIYAKGTEFQIGRIDMVANTGTYIDMPFHRYADGHDLADLPLELVQMCQVCWSEWKEQRNAKSTGTISRRSSVAAMRCLSIPAGTGTGAQTTISRAIHS